MRTLFKVIAATALAMGLSGIAFADGDGGDSSMSLGYGESWAYFHAEHALSQPRSAENDQSTVTSSPREPSVETAKNAPRKRAFMTFDDGTRG